MTDRPYGIKADPPTLAAGQRSVIQVYDVRSGEASIVWETSEHLFEAPNWVGDRLIVNGGGRLWEVPLGDEVRAPRVIPLEGIPDVNNDHVPAADQASIFASAYDWHVYRAPLAGGRAVRVTPSTPDPFMYFLHGVSPDARRLAFVGVRPAGARDWSDANIYTIDVDGSDLRQLTTGNRPADGCEYSADGGWIYFNTEAFSSTPGHAQIARMRLDGSELTQLTSDERVNWFPHLAPRGDLAVYLSFPPGTVGHPPDRDVELRLVRDGDWAGAQTVVRLYGGQGTINVNSWSPEGDRFAFVSYPVAVAA